MQKSIEIVDRGRGPQLSTSRITVQDLVPYFQRKASYEEIMSIIPILTVPEIQVIERYVQENYEAVMAQDRRILERRKARELPPEEQARIRKERQAFLERARLEIRKKLQERNGDQAHG
jgi:hypothetical protein